MQLGRCVRQCSRAGSCLCLTRRAGRTTEPRPSTQKAKVMRGNSLFAFTKPGAAQHRHNI
jgi:hypothetical protein